MVRDAEETGVWGGERRNRAMWRFYDGQGHHHFAPWVKSCFSMIEGWQQGTGTWQFERQKKLVLWTLGNNNKLDKSSIRGAANNSYFQHQLVYRLFSQSSCSLWNVTNQWKNSHHNFSEPRWLLQFAHFVRQQSKPKGYSVDYHMTKKSTFEELQAKNVWHICLTNIWNY